MSMEFTIRKMCEADLQSVASVEAGVFTDWYRVHRRDPEPLPERTLEELRYATSIDPDGNLVAISAEGAMVGFILSRSWGSVGWFGTFAVPTQFQGMGIGKALIACTVQHLRETSSIIGLETMPESGANLGLYAKMGFVVGFPTLIMETEAEAYDAPVETAGDVLAWSALDDAATSRYLDELRAVGDAILPGLDYTCEVAAMTRHGFGETFLAVRDGGLDGFAVLRTEPFRKAEGGGHAYVHLLALRPGCDRKSTFRALLGRLRAGAAEAGLASLVAGVSGRYPEALDLFYSEGFRSRRASIRMLEQGSRPDAFERSCEINSSRWVG